MVEDQVPLARQALVGVPWYPVLHTPVAVIRALVFGQVAYPVVVSAGQVFTRKGAPKRRKGTIIIIMKRRFTLKKES